MRLHLGVMIQQPLDGVGDLQLAASRRPDGTHRLEDLGREEVHADQRQIRLGLRGLLHQPDDVPILQLGDAKALRRLHRRQQDHRVGPAFGEFLDERLNSVADQVVAEIHDK